MAKSVQLEIITPASLFYKGNVEIVIVRTLTGDEGFMANHVWATKLLDAGEMWFRETGSKDFKIAAIAHGYVDVRQNIVIYTDAAEWPEQIDVQRAERSKARAEAWLKEHRSLDEDEDELNHIRRRLKKAKTRLNVKAGGRRRKQ